MHECLFADAARPRRVAILKLRMSDYSIGHEILLWQQRNPLVTYTEDSFNELPLAERHLAIMRAALTCYRNWEQNQRPEKNLRLWSWRIRKLDLDIEIQKFRDYRDAGSLEFPTVPMPRVSGAPYHYFGAPEVARLLNFIATNNLHSALRTPRSAFDFPLGLAKSLYLAHAEAEGSLWIENWHDYQEKERLKAFEQANPESTLAVGEDAVQAAAEKWNAEHPDCPVPLPREMTVDDDE